MKTLSLSIVLLLSIGCYFISFNKTEPIYITKSEDGYNIFSHDKKLLLEFTKQNSDSLSLETLKYIYEVSNEYKNNPELFNGRKLEILNMSEE